MKLNKLLLAALSTTFILTHPSLAMNPDERTAGVTSSVKQDAVRLREAALGSDVDGVRALLSRGVDPNTSVSHGDVLLHQVLLHGIRIEIIQALLEAGADPHALNSNGANVFHSLHNIACLPIFRKAGVDINKCTNEERFTPLHRAVLYGTRELVEEFLKAGANPDIQNSGGQTPYDLAVLVGNTEHAQVLSEWNAAQLALQGKE